MAKNKKNKFVEENIQLVGEVTEVIAETTSNAEEPFIVTEHGVVTDTVIGIVEGCEKLNIRATDDVKAKVVCVVTNGSELTVDLTKSNPDWLSVVTPDGKSGFCMAKYVSLGK